MKNKKLVIIALFMVILIIGGGIGCWFIFNNSNNKKDTIENNTNDDVVINDKSGLQLLKDDYNSGKIDINKYFSELINYEYFYSSLDEKYKNDDNILDTSNLSYIVEVLDEHKYEINKDLIKKLANQVFLSDVSIGLENTSSIDTQSNNNINPKIVPLANDEEPDMSYMSNHNLDKLYLSENGHFLIWYTDTGDDAVGIDSVKNISETLENTISKYEGTYGVTYSYTPFKDGLISRNYISAKKVLTEKGMNPSVLDTAMNVYIYDCGEKFRNDGTLATYNGSYSASLLISIIKLLGIDDLFIGNQGVIATPYIILNLGLLDMNNYDDFKMAVNHELFHHFQSLYRESSKTKNLYYEEAMANFSSALASDASSINYENFLNSWNIWYTDHSNLGILSQARDGYESFGYYYEYSNVVDNWSSILLEAHNMVDPNGYIKRNTSRDDLVKVMENLIYHNLYNEYDNLSLATNNKFVVLDSINVEKTIDSIANPGAVIFYEVEGSKEVKVTSGDNDYLGIKLYGYKNDTYTELDSSMQSILKNLNNYSGYDKFYIAIYNADPAIKHSYSVVVNNSSPNTPDNTTENNNTEDSSLTDNFISYNDCNGTSDEISLTIDTYYLNEDGIAYKKVVTVFLTDEADYDGFLENKQNPTYFTNVRLIGNVLQYEYTDEWFKELYSSYYNTKDRLDYKYGMSCSLECSGESCKWGSSDGKTIDFDPKSIK